MNPSPTYLLTHQSGYYFRIAVPHSLRDVVGKNEFRCSLRTGALGRARYLARVMAAQSQRVFNDIRNGGRMAELSKERIQDLLRGYYQKALDDDEDYREQRRSPATDEELEVQLDYYRFETAETREALARSDYRDVYEQVDELLKESGISIDRESDSYRKLCRGLLKARIAVLDVCKDREQGRCGDDDMGFLADRVQTAAQVSVVAKPQADKGLPLSEVIQMYAKAESQRNDWTDKTYDTNINDSLLGLMVGVMGDVPIGTIDRRKMDEFIDVVRRLPPNREKLFPGIPASHLAKMKHDRLMSVSTINKHLSRVATLFRWAIRWELYHGANPAEGVVFHIKGLLSAVVFSE